jgi:transcriptional regulator with XRE-family HTH domain
MSNQEPARTGLTLPSSLVLLGATALAKLENLKIGERITRCRKDRGLTQKELAKRLGVTQPVVSNYENDVIRIPADVVIQLAAILQVSADELLGLKGSDTAKGIQNRRLNRRLAAIEKLGKRDQEALLRTIDAFVSKAS